jgi:hypothetical protein
MIYGDRIMDNLLTVLSTLIVEKDEDAGFRLKEQQTNLANTKCTKPDLGKWIDNCDFPFLIETLMLDHTIFVKEFAGIEFPEEERKTFARSLEAHCEDCVHCHLKRSYDLEWQNRVNSALTENRTEIGKALAHHGGRT